jgi:hypothetical protein
MSKRLKIYMGIPSTGNRSDFQCYSLREIERRYSDRVELVYPKDCVYRIFHDAARNGIVEDFLASDCDVLWFLDSDIAPPVDVIEFITEHYEQWDLAGLPYPVFMSPSPGERQKAVVCVYEHDGTAMKAARVPKDGMKFVDGLATGCLFIKRHIFDQLERPFFEFKYDPITRNMVEGEDLGFCRKVNALGYKFLTDFGKVCAHYKTVNLLEVINYATEYAQTHVDALHAEIRPQVARLAAEIERLKKEKAAPKIAPASMSDLLAIKNSLPPPNRGPKL